MTRPAEQAHAFLASIVESSDDAIIGGTLDGMIASWNRGAEALFGYRAEEVMGRPLTMIVPPEELPNFLEGQERLKRGENLPRFEALGVRKDGTRFEISIAVSALRDAAGQIVAIAAIIRDISERKRAEEALRQAEEKYRRIFDDAVVGIFQTTPDGRYLSMNRALARMYGDESPERRQAEITDIGGQAYVDPGKREEFKRLMEEHGELRNFEYQVLRRDGSKIWFSENARAVRDASGEILYYEGTVEDITLRKRAEQALCQSEERYRRLVDNLPDVTWTSDQQGRTTYISSSVEKVLGCTPKEICDLGEQGWLGRVHPQDVNRVLEAYQSLCASNRPFDVEYQMQRKDGEWIWVHDRSVHTYEAEGTLYADGLFSDITERKRTEEALRASESKFRLLFERTADALMLLDATSGLFVDCNATAVAMLGCSDRQELLSLHPAEISSPHQPDGRPTREKADEMIAIAMKEGSHRFEWVHRTAHRTDFPVEVLLTPIQTGEQQLIVATCRDISERKQAEEARQRLAAIIEHTTDLVGQADSEGRLTYINAAGLRMLGGDRLPQVLGRPIRDFHTPESAVRVLGEAIPAALRDGMWTGETELLALDGRIIPVSQLIFVERAADGSVKHTTAVMRDLTARMKADAALRQAHEKLNIALQESEQHARQAVQLSELVDLLQSCQNVEEAYKVMQSALPATLSCQAGALCVTNSSRNVVEAMAIWGDPLATEKTFRPNDCWALRRGRIHQVVDPASPLRCAHVSGCPAHGHLCVPLVAHGETLGVLYLEYQPTCEPPATPADQMEGLSRQAADVAERVSLALANLRLREALRAQSIRDPLTGLFNRRYMEETLERELSRAARSEQPVSLLMLDIDHFKKFNDTFGHQAGDKLLRAFGDSLIRQTRGQDVACRYGGEEFVLILAGASLEAARQRGEFLREDLKQLMVEHAGEVLGKVTISTGISVYPNHGASAEELLRAADAALYRAKAEGRDRVVVA